MSEMNKNYLHNMFIDEVEGSLHRNCVTEEKVEEKIRQAQIGGDGEVDLSMYAKATEVAQLKSDFTELETEVADVKGALDELEADLAFGHYISIEALKADTTLCTISVQ